MVKKKTEWFAVQHYPSRFRFPKGESLREVQHRAVTALEEIAEKHEKEMVAVVSHADVIKLALAQYMGIHIDLFQRVSVAPASVSVIALMKGGVVRVLRVNDNGPLRPPAGSKQDDGPEDQTDRIDATVQEPQQRKDEFGTIA